VTSGAHVVHETFFLTTSARDFGEASTVWLHILCVCERDDACMHGWRRGVKVEF
jgi:hypothetical protein